MQTHPHVYVDADACPVRQVMPADVVVTADTPAAMAP
jgi:uncharacterized protein YaiI (UPF0178 family)